MVRLPKSSTSGRMSLSSRAATAPVVDPGIVATSSAPTGTVAPLTHEEKQLLCEQLSALPRSQAVDVYRLLTTRSRELAIKMPRRLGTTEPGPFGSQRLGDDYRFQIDLIPPEVLHEVQCLLELK